MTNKLQNPNTKTFRTKLLLLAAVLTMVFIAVNNVFAQSFNIQNSNKTKVENRIEASVTSGGNQLKDGALNKGEASAQADVVTIIDDEVVQNRHIKEEATGNEPVDINEGFEYKSEDGRQKVKTDIKLHIEDGRDSDTPNLPKIPFLGVVDQSLDGTTEANATESNSNAQGFQVKQTETSQTDTGQQGASQKANNRTKTSFLFPDTFANLKALINSLFTRLFKWF